MKTTRLFLTIFISISAIQSYSQNSNEFRIYYGISDGELLRNESLDGAGVYKVENFNEIGIRYLRNINDNFSIETGLNFLKLNTEFNYITGDGLSGETIYEKLEIVTIPIYANYTFWKYLFVNGGPIIDFQSSNNTSDSQSGIGYSLGFGGKYYFENFLIFVNPNFKRHSLIPFEKEKYHQKLTELGLQFGIGYKF